jgi:spermidine synthase
MDIEYSEIDHEETPLGRLVLRRYRSSSGETGYEISLDGSFLMASHGSHSERAMAGIAARLLPPCFRDLHALVGGLGAGHTLRAVLDLPGIARVDVAEIGAKVVAWNRRYFADANDGAVDDPRVSVHVGDVLDLVHGCPDRYHLVLLDVDNGPGWLVTPANARLYGAAGLDACRACLRPGGVLAIWSPQRNRGLESALSERFDRWHREVTSGDARRQREPPSVIYLCSRFSAGADAKN